MKYIKLKIIFITGYLGHNIYNYTINDNLTVDVNGNVSLEYKTLTEIPVKFNIVNGYFDCSHNLLTSLKNSPKKVNAFYCYNNQLTSLKYLPEIITNTLTINNNQITSLKYIPDNIQYIFCLNNPINTLKYIPVNNMINNTIYNTYDKFRKNIPGEYTYFSWNQKELDNYWEKEIKNEISVFKNLEINNKEIAYKSNQISKELYNKFKYLGRANKSGLLDIKK